MATILLLTRVVTPSVSVLPGLELLSHHVKTMTPEPTALLSAPPCDLILVDARTDLPAARSLCRLMEATGNASPVMVISTEGGLAAIASDWGISDVILDTAGPAEIETRIRLAVGRVAIENPQATQAEIHAGELVIDETAYSAKLRGRILDLTYKEFELLKYLAQHPGRVFSRSQLLQEVWGYDYFGGTRTVDVHIRRLRAKLGVENESLIGTVRNVGYRFVAGNSEATEDSLV
ncbi:MAG: DNA-binding response regulator [Actinobacteria bacterium]|nr:DNA-binding response regulator [Actinomycetota bacterium]NBY15734.1 DNA-binding response regulator [Actinomycetota bacterium]